MKHDPLPPAAAEPAAEILPSYTPVTIARARHDGWTADRQRTFLSTLAETGSISAACKTASITARSAYRLRVHPDGAAFAEAWDQALHVATATLTTLAFERATRGTIRELWKNGELIGETLQPSDGMLKWLLAHLAPERFGNPGPHPDQPTRVATAAVALPRLLDGLGDSAVRCDPLTAADFRVQAPPHAHDPRSAPVDLDDQDEWDDAWNDEPEDDD